MWNLITFILNENPQHLQNFRFNLIDTFTDHKNQDPTRCSKIRIVLDRYLIKKNENSDKNPKKFSLQFTHIMTLKIF